MLNTNMDISIIMDIIRIRRNKSNPIVFKGKLVKGDLISFLFLKINTSKIFLVSLKRLVIT